VSALGAYVLQTVVTLVVLGLIAFGLIHLQRRATLSGARGPLELWGRLPLEARKTVYLVKVGEQVLVLGASESGLALLTTLAAKDLPVPEATERAPGAVLHSSLLEGWLKKEPKP
jgi:flagellar biogenesis protein FliO